MRYILKKSNNLNISEYVEKLKGFKIEKHIFTHYNNCSKEENVYIIEIDNVSDFNEIMKILNKDLILKDDSYIVDEFNPIDPKTEVPERTIVIYDDWREL